MKKIPHKLMIGLPNASGFFPKEVVESLLMLRKNVPTMVQIVERQRIDKARNYIAMQALNAGCTHLLFIDDDNPPPVDTIEKMLEDDKDIVCAPIPTRSPDEKGNYKLCIFTKENRDDLGGMTLYNNIEKVDTTNGVVIKVEGCGMGCTMIKREVLEKLFKKYDGKPFEFGDKIFYSKDKKKNQRRTMSEDMEFCERAMNEGYEIWCDTRLRPKHLSTPRYTQFSDHYIK